MDLTKMGIAACEAKRILGTSSTQQRNEALKLISKQLILDLDTILQANEKDIITAREMGISEAMIDRLVLNESRVKAISKAVLDIIELPDPCGKVLEEINRPNGLKIEKVSVPLGVIGIIFESRPNVTVDAAVLCLKTGNVTILRGGKEAIHSNTALCDSMQKALVKAGLPKDSVALIKDTTRESSTALMQLTGYVDVLIPRGGKGLIQAVVQNSKVPVIETGAGNCHVFIDKSADLKMAVKIIDNAKTQRPSVCNAAETLLVHQDIASKVLPLVKEALDKSNVKLLGDERTIEILGNEVVKATEEDYFTEFNDYILSIKVVNDTNEAIDHIAKYSSGHSECIVTNDQENANLFTKSVDSAAVYVNASTRFTDGAEFGFGAEIGISTQKLHARGPMGLKELTSVKYIVNGNGQIR